MNRRIDRLTGRVIGKDGNPIMSGNIIIQGMNISLVELARRVSEGGGSPVVNVDVESITEQEIDEICV